MAQARQADRAMPQVAILAAILVAAMLAVAVLTIGTPNFTGTPKADTGDRGEISPALIQAERDWEFQRRQQSGWVDPLARAEHDWEFQRRQQSGLVDPLARAERDWEFQRRQQSGGSE